MTGHANILTIDDTPTSLKFLNQTLTDEGYHVRTTISGKEGLRLAFKNPPELILLDIIMPEMDGFEVCRQLKAAPETKEIPIIFLSSHNANEEIAQGFRIGAVDFISKPFKRDELLARVRTHLELFRFRTRLESLVNEKTHELTQERNRAKSYLDLVQVTIASFDRNGRVTMINQAGKRLLGIDSDTDIIGRKWFKEFLLQPAGMETFYPDFQRMIANKHAETTEVEYIIITQSGEQRTVSSRNSLLLDAQGSSIGILSAIDDITERKKTEESLRLASSVFENSSEGMMITNVNNQIVATNPAFEEITGYTNAEVIGKFPSILKSGKHDANFYSTMWQEILATGKWHGEIWDSRKNGEIYPKWLTINTIYNHDKSINKRVALFVDISEKKQTEDLIWKQANFDLATNLPNRFMFQDRLMQEIQRSLRTEESVVLMFLDLDHFKEINDTYGHSVGDLLLKEVACRIRRSIRISDTVARMGGDEFTVILSQIKDNNIVIQIAENLIQQFLEPFYINSACLYISTSIGIAFYPQDGETVEDLIKNADQALYSAKEKGRNCYDFFVPSMQEAAQIRMKLINELRTALSENQFRLYYQPIVNLSTGEINKAEALIRWLPKNQGMQSPDIFIPILEQTRLINHVGDWVFKKAANQAKRWRLDRHPDFQISINVSPIQFLNSAQLSLSWLEHLKTIDLAGEAIVVEITEGLLLDASKAITGLLLDFHKTHIEVSLDDFGTGYSSLAYLKKFHIDYLKIDKYFIKNLAPNTDDLVLIEAIVKMAHTLGLKVIAEGVETAEQLQLLVNTGCDYGQGFLFSKPLPVEEFEKLSCKTLIVQSNKQLE